jgi:phosphoglycolate phosphatase
MNATLKNKFDSIIFDLDGTLWDSAESVALAWQASKQQVDYVNEDITPAMVSSIAGLPYDAIFYKLFPYLSTVQEEHFRNLCGKLELETLSEKGGMLYPELEETLEYLAARYKLFVVSNCQSGYIEVFLKTSKLGHYFAGHQCYGTKSQPKAENIKDIVVNHQLKQPVYVGDTQGDYDSSTKAGVPFIFAAYGFGSVKGDRVADVATLSELRQLL